MKKLYLLISTLIIVIICSTAIISYQLGKRSSSPVLVKEKDEPSKKIDSGKKQPDEKKMNFILKSPPRKFFEDDEKLSDEEKIQIAKQKLKSIDLEEKRQAIFQIRKLDPKGSLKILKDTILEPNLAIDSARALLFIDKPPDDVYKTIKEASNNPDLSEDDRLIMKITAIDAGINSKEIDVFNFAMQCLADHNVEIRKATVAAIFRFPDDEAIPLLLQALSDPDKEVQEGALNLLGTKFFEKRDEFGRDINKWKKWLEGEKK